MVLRRLQTARAFDEQPRVVHGRADLFVELVARQEPRLLAEDVAPFFDRVLQPRDMAFVVRQEEPARAHVVTVDRPLVDELLDQGERVEDRVDELAAERAVLAGQPPGPVLQLGDDHPAVARARAHADAIGVEHERTAPPAGELGTGDRSAVAGADDDDVGRRGERARVVELGGVLDAGVPERRPPGTPAPAGRSTARRQPTGEHRRCAT